MYKRIRQLRSNSTQQNYNHGGGILGIFGSKKDDLIDHYGKKLEDIEQNVRLRQAEASLIAEVCFDFSNYFFSHFLTVHSFLLIFISIKCILLNINCCSMLKEARAAFVFFKSRYGAASAFHLQPSINPTQWITEPAPAPKDVYWPFFSESFMKQWVSKLVVIVVCILFTISFLIPVVLVQGLTNLKQLEILFPFLASILSM